MKKLILILLILFYSSCADTIEVKKREFHKTSNNYHEYKIGSRI